MAIHLNYDGYQNNGIIFNDKYPNGVLFKGVELKPNLSFKYHSFEYSEVFLTRPNRVINKDLTVRLLTTDEVAEIVQIATNWVQPLGQEGNPTVKQARDIQQNYILGKFNEAIEALTENAQDHEMTSWRKQEEEARAYVVDNSVATPFIDLLLTSRALDETKDDLVSKIITNADAYQNAYAALLGKYQNLTKQITAATTVVDVEAIAW